VEEVIWVEILSRQREVAQRHRCAGPEIHIGRGYGNDVIVDDPLVAPEHLRIYPDPSGALIAEDLGSANGLFAERRRGRLDRVLLDGDRAIRIGRTWLRVREAGHQVPPDRAVARIGLRWVAAALLAIAIIGIEVLSNWAGETGEPKLSKQLLPLLGLTGAALVWAAVWAILGRIFAGEARFVRNLLIVLGGVLAFSIFNELVQFVGFALSWHWLRVAQPYAIWVVLGVVCFLHLRETGRSHLVLKGAAVAGLALLVVSAQWLSQSEARLDTDYQRYTRRLMPPALRLVPLESEAAFFGEVEQIRKKLDRDRSKSTAPSSFLGSFFGGDEGGDDDED
jgi:hypothetical protein